MERERRRVERRCGEDTRRGGRMAEMVAEKNSVQA